MVKKLRVFKDDQKWSDNKDLQYFSKVNREHLDVSGFPIKYFVLENILHSDDILSEITLKEYETAEVPLIFAWWEGDDPIVELEKAGLSELIVEKRIFVNKYRFHELFDKKPECGDVIYITYIHKWVEVKEVREYQHSHGSSYYSTMYSLAVEDLKLDGSSELHEPSDDEMDDATVTNEEVETTVEEWVNDDAENRIENYIDWVDTSNVSTNSSETEAETKREARRIKEILFEDEII